MKNGYGPHLTATACLVSFFYRHARVEVGPSGRPDTLNQALPLFLVVVEKPKWRSSIFSSELGRVLLGFRPGLGSLLPFSASPHSPGRQGVVRGQETGLAFFWEALSLLQYLRTPISIEVSLNNPPNAATWVVG